MYKKLISMIIMFLIVASTALALSPGKSINVRGARIFEEYVVAGDELVTLIKVANAGEKRIKDLRVTIVIQDLGIRERTRSLSVRGNRVSSRMIILDIPTDAKEGWYPIRITLSNEDLRKVFYRYVYVSPNLRVVYL